MLFSRKQRTTCWGPALRLEVLEERCLLSASSLPAGGFDHLVATSDKGNTLLALTSQNDLYSHTDAGGWVELGQDIIAASASAEKSGTVVTFALLSDHALARYDSASGWQTIGAPGTILSMSSGTDQNGNADLFVTTAGGEFTEYSGSSGWLRAPLGAPGTILSWDALANDGVVAVTTNHQVMEHDDQFGWFALSGTGFAQSVSAVTDASGTLIVYATTPGQALYQLTSGIGWTPLGAAGTVSSISSGLDDQGQAMVAVLTTAADLLEYDTTVGWFFVHPPGPVTAVSAAPADTIYFVLQDGSVFGHDDQFGSFRLTSIGFAET